MGLTRTLRGPFGHPGKSAEGTRDRRIETVNDREQRFQRQRQNRLARHGSRRIAGPGSCKLLRGTSPAFSDDRQPVTFALIIPSIHRHGLDASCQHCLEESLQKEKESDGPSRAVDPEEKTSQTNLERNQQPHTSNAQPGQMSMPSDQQQLYEQDQGEQELEARSSSLYHQKQQRQENDRQLDTARSSSLPAANGVLANGSVPTSPEPLTTASLTPRISSSPGLQAQGQYHQAPSQQQLQQLNGFTEAGSSQHHQDSLFAPPGPSRYSSLPSARRIAPVPSNMATEIGSAAAAAGGPGGFPLGERTDGRMDDAGPSSFPGVQNGSSPSRGGLSISSGPIGPPRKSCAIGVISRVCSERHPRNPLLDF